MILSCINAVLFYFESTLLTGSETYRQAKGHRRGGILIVTGWDGENIKNANAENMFKLLN